MKKIHLICLALFLLIGNTFSQNNALNFDGIDDDVALNYSPALDFSLNSKFTIEAWFQTTSGTLILWSTHVDTAPFVGYEISIYNGTVNFEMFNDYMTNGIRIGTIYSSCNDGNWHHVACVYHGIPNASNCDIYIDGNLQTVNIVNNTLSSSFSSGNNVHIGSRNNTTYFAAASLDEIRVWKRDLCAAEIQARKNCQLNGNEYGLEAYYNFNQGVASGNNSSLNSLIDLTANNHTGALSNFSLNGPTSNWIASTSSVSGTCSLFGNLIFNGPGHICSGASTTLSVSGANTYTWLPGNITTPNITVSPSASVVYTVNATVSGSCIATAVYSLTVSNCTGIPEISGSIQNLNIYPNPVNDELFFSEYKNIKSIEIYNLLGKLVLKESTDDGRHSLNVRSLDKGIYFLSVISNDSKHTVKFIKE